MSMNLGEIILTLMSTTVMIIPMLFMMILWVAMIVFPFICLWKIFEKMGEEGWKSLIPVYNVIILFNKIGLSTYLLFIYLSPFLLFLCFIVMFIPIIGFFIFYFVMIIVITAVNALTIVQNIYLGKAFKKDTGFLVGLAVVPVVFQAILAFDKNSKYEFNSDEKPIVVEKV